MTPSQRRTFEARRKQERKVEALNPRLQRPLPEALHDAQMARYVWKGVSKNLPDDEELPPLEVPPVPLRNVPACQVSFERVKRCLRCRALNKFCATECRRCFGLLRFDKTPAPDVPEASGGDE